MPPPTTKRSTSDFCSFGDIMASLPSVVLSQSLFESYGFIIFWFKTEPLSDQLVLTRS
jgi:hypothetical protein